MNYQNHRDYLTAASWMDDLKPLSKEAADIALAYSRERYLRMTEAFAALDKKADAILQLTGGAGAAFTVAAALSGPSADLVLGLPLIPVLAAGIFALIARWPTNVPDAARICDLIDDLHDHGVEKMEGLMAGSYHCAVVGLRIVIARKAKWVMAASVCVCITIAMLGAALAFRYFCPLPPTQSSGAAAISLWSPDHATHCAAHRRSGAQRCAASVA